MTANVRGSLKKAYLTVMKSKIKDEYNNNCDAIIKSRMQIYFDKKKIFWMKCVKNCLCIIYRPGALVNIPKTSQTIGNNAIFSSDIIMFLGVGVTLINNKTNHFQYRPNIRVFHRIKCNLADTCENLTSHWSLCKCSGCFEQSNDKESMKIARQGSR